MSRNKTRAALTQAWVDGNFSLDTAYENKKFDKPAALPWAEFWVVFDSTNSVTLGTHGENETTGFVQVDLYYPLDKGSGDITTKADAICEYFQLGRSFSYQGQYVTIQKIDYSPARPDGGRHRLTLTIYFYARHTR